MTRAEHRAADELNDRKPGDCQAACVQQLDELGALLAHLRDQIRQRPDLNAWQLSRLLMVAVDTQARIETAAHLASLDTLP